MTPRNRLLRACCEHDMSAVLAYFEETPLVAGRVLLQGRVPIQRVLFVEEGLVATTPSADGEHGSIGAWIVGREGMVGGVPVLLGATSSPHKRTVIARGRALSLSRENFLKLINSNADFKAQLLLYVNKILVETTQICACTGRHSVRQRIARVLLTAFDRLGRPELPLTHRLVAQLLSVRRATVSESLQELAAENLLSMARSSITLLRVPELEAIACRCYDVIRRLDRTTAPHEVWQASQPVK